MEVHFRVNSRLMHTKGSGWSPFNRIKWLYEGRESDPNRTQGGMARWQASQRSLQIRRARGLDQDPKWQTLGPTNIAGRILSIAFHPTHPDTAYVGSASGGIWETTNGGESWIPLGDDLPSLAIGAIALAARDPRIVVIGTGEPTIAYDTMYGLGILRSTDAGRTWQQTNIVDEPFRALSGYHAIDVNPLTGAMLAASADGVLRSEDDGATWATVVAGGNWTDVKWRPGTRDSALAVREYGGTFLSSDGGITFNQVTAGLPAGSSIGGLAKLAWSASDPRYVYAGFSAADSFTTLGIYRSTDAGATWELRSNEPSLYGYQGFYNNSIIVDPRDPERVLVGGVFLNLSIDGGTTWRWVGPTLHVDHHAITFRPGYDAEVWVGTDGGVFQSGDRGITWEPRNAGLVTLQLYDACAAWNDSTVAYGGTQDNGTLRYSTTSGWEYRTGGDGMLCHCDPDSSGHVYGEHQFGSHFVSHDGLQHYTSITMGLYGTSRFVAPVDMDPRDPMRLFTATQWTGIFETTNGGSTWSRVGDGNDVVSISISPVTPRRIWAQERSSGMVRTSSDGGISWSATMAAPIAPIGGTKILADPVDSMAAFCAYLHHTSGAPLIMRTTDGGASWIDVTGDLGEQSVNTIAVDPSMPTRWFVGTDVGVWLSEDSGATWLPYGAGLPNALVPDLEFRGMEGDLRAATHGRGLWSVNTHLEPPPPTTAAQPALLELASQNPARGSIVFRFGVSVGTRTELTVHSATGRSVATVYVGPADGVVRRVEWRTQDVSSGVYFVTLRSGSVTATKKFVVLR